ncbi:phenylalanine--tRNA ligase subunit beta [Sphingomonas sp. PR090111-T3T-6A]|uniref:phenylalanine--tRNA ligase subunit beta n=1 Tax=Sphingomonas sp. PR090111-T3T-6A TaxID=685778 RepID=UPI00037F1070|nr:phenylalanine--tRNA ligase subunit beta [Sphingomonas sp. PR090111-T3T-6A]
MKFTLSWLKEHLDTTADATQVADALTRIGLEVEDISNPADVLRPFRIARVLTAAPHPQADKLQVLSVDAGEGPLQVVCGAPNARAGLVGIFGGPGMYVPGPEMTLKLTSIRGVESNGMMCSFRELLLGEDHNGIVELPEDAPVGESYAEWAGLDDPLFDVAITPNRQDCMGVRGIARDLAAAGLGTLKPLADVYRMESLMPVAGDDPAPDVRTDDTAGCPAFFAQSVSGVTNGDSPEWMSAKLKAIGQKPISMLVDITNFVSIDLGRPLHVYDRAKLSGALVARKAKDGEQVEALNGKTYTLDATMTVIADDAAVHDIGGIMGGEHSGVSETTTDVLIECAYFDPDHIALTGQKLVLTSDARQRFERGVDPAFLDDGLAIATKLVLDHCGGTASAITRAGEPPLAKRVIAYHPRLCADLGGMFVAPERQARILLSLGFSVGAITSPDAFSDALFSTIEGAWPVTVPTWRRDVDGPADLVEEVIRIEGLDKLPSTPLPRAEGVAKPTATPEQRIERKARRAAAARGFAEAVTWSFLSEKEAAVFGGGHWTLSNPISEDLKVMRPSLIPGLARAAQRNRDRGERSVKLFELGRRYLADAERQTLTVLIAGESQGRDWQTGKAHAADAFDAKAEALAVLAAAGAPVERLQLIGPGGETWHPGRSGQLGLGPKMILATFGELHPETLRALDVEGPVVAAEIYLDAIPAKRDTGRTRPAYAPSALQAVRRDFAFLVAADLQADKLIRAIQGADKQAIVEVSLFDVFTGQGVPEGQKSLGLEVVLQPADKSFDEAALKAIADKIVAAAAKQGATLRG